MKHLAQIPPRYYNKLRDIAQETFTKHALGKTPWGAEKLPNGLTSCLYTRACAIGLHLSGELADELDSALSTPGVKWLLLGTSERPDWSRRARTELFGDEEVPPDVVIDFLEDLQSAHDTAARLDDRSYYRGRLEMLCRHYDILLVGRA